jgi:protein-S-isoprenylcysteine O-methyltransferase Ste14
MVLMDKTMAKKKRDFIPIIMGVVLLAGILALTVVRSLKGIGDWEKFPVNMDFGVVGLYLAWLVLELRVSKKDAHKGDKENRDMLTCQLYGTGQALTILSALWFPAIWQGPHAAHGLGVGLFIAGAGYRLWAVRTLGKFYSHRVRRISQHRIVDSGPYQFTRHPAYAGMIIAHLGIILYFFNWVTLGIFLFLLIPAIVLRIIIEEKTLYSIQGYTEFAMDRKRLFPGIW